MSDLTTFRDHARAMVDADHKPECAEERKGSWGATYLHRPDSTCSGCIPDAERALWTRLADEVDAYLAGDLIDVDLFGDETPLPEVRDA